MDSSATARINAARFTKRATTLLKASSSGVDASLLSQMKDSIAVLSRQQAGNGSGDAIDKKLLVELEELRNLANEAIPITSPVRGQELPAGDEAVSKEVKDNDDIRGAPEQTSSKSASHKKKAGSAARRQNFTLSAGAVAMGESSPPAVDSQDVHDTTSAEKITSLLQQSKDISAQELEQEQHKHNQLLGQVSELVGSLKEATLLMNKLVEEQNVQLDEITQVAGENMNELSDQREKMKEATKEMGTSVWATVGTLLWLMTMFAVTYMVMRLFPKPAP